MKKIVFAWIVSAILGTLSAFAQGGPPMVTDDPGTPGDGNWEINLASAWSKSDGQTSQLAPLFDINYGYGNQIQLNLNKAYIRNSGSSGSSSGNSAASLAVKYRFVEEEKTGVAISTYPRVDFNDGFSSKDSRVNYPGSRYFLPIEFAKDFGAFAVNPEIGYATYTDGFPSEWAYGLVLAYSSSKDTDWLAELHGRSTVGASDTEWLYNFGVRYPFSKHASFIGSAGRTFKAYDSALASKNLYLGVQIHL